MTGTAVLPPVITAYHYNPATRQFTLTWTLTTGAQVTGQEKASLTSATWNTLQSNIASGGSTTTTTVTMPSGTAGFLQVFQQ